MIQEFANRDTRVLMSHEPGKVAVSVSHAELLPYAFQSNSLTR
jgi:cytidine deaminase